MASKITRQKDHTMPPTKTRSRHGCCGEEKPSCLNCSKQGGKCDYSVRLNWDGRTKKKDEDKYSTLAMVFDGNGTALSEQPPQRVRHRNGNGSANAFGSGARSGLLGAAVQSHRSPDTSFRQNQGQVNCRTSLTRPFQNFTPSAETPTTLPLYFDGRSNPRFDNLPFQNPGSAQTMAQQSQTRLSRPIIDYPSPLEYALGTSDKGTTASLPTPYLRQMPAPQPIPMSAQYTDGHTSPERCSTRLWSEAGNGVPHTPDRSRLCEVFSSNSNNVHEISSLPFTPHTPNAPRPHAGGPMTPPTSSPDSDENHQTGRSHADVQSIDQRQLRRMSVNSLLSGPPEVEHTSMAGSFAQQPKVGATSSIFGYGPGATPMHTHSSSYGLDRGLPDLDLPRNNDRMAISSFPPIRCAEGGPSIDTVDPKIPVFGCPGEKRQFVFVKGGSYASPVPLKIPRSLEPLPSTLLENAMNLLYFHHFLNYTARILVVHDCSHNPFRTILPQMAIENRHVLNLLLAYSATHRARLLAHPEPALRIAHWVQDVFPSLRHALDAAESSNAEVSDANLATAIMLTSLEIISPSAFGVSVSWPKHLEAARRIIRYRRNRLQPVPRTNPVLYFLQLWLAYIDVFGSLSSRSLDEPPDGSTLADLHHDPVSGALDTEDYTIECMLGFTPHLISILARIAELAKLCSVERIDNQTGKVDRDWRPGREIEKECDKLELDLENSRRHPVEQCPHYLVSNREPAITAGTGSTLPKINNDNNASNQNTETNPNPKPNTNEPDDQTLSSLESTAANNAFHHAALIHLLRRIRNLPRTSPRIRHAIHGVVVAISAIRPGTSADACLLFPMFTAGAETEAEDGATRLVVLDRVRRLEEEMGMMQVAKARSLMQSAWRSGLEWETLARGEFFWVG